MNFVQIIEECLWKTSQEYPIPSIIENRDYDLCK